MDKLNVFVTQWPHWALHPGKWYWEGNEGAKPRRGEIDNGKNYSCESSAKRGAKRWCRRHNFEPVFEGGA